jgi:nucleotide-binding universal stress UspA family protein
MTETSIKEAEKKMKVLLATEGSDFSKAAIEKCCSMFDEADNTELRIVTAAKPVIIPAEPFALSAEYIAEVDGETFRQAEQVAANAETVVRKRIPSIKHNLTTSVSVGSPAQVIVDEAERWGADLIVVGSHGYGFWQRALLGSVSNAVIHHAPCSVLVVRTPKDSNGNGH